MTVNAQWVGSWQDGNRASQVALAVKNLPANDPWVSKIPWRRKSKPTPVFFPGESYGHRSLAGCRVCRSIGSQRVGHDWSNLAHAHTQDDNNSDVGYKISLLKVCPGGEQHQYSLGAHRNAKSQAPPQTSWGRARILTRSLGDLCAHRSSSSTATEKVLGFSDSREPY